MRVTKTDALHLAAWLSEGHDAWRLHMVLARIFNIRVCEILYGPDLGDEICRALGK